MLAKFKMQGWKKQVVDIDSQLYSSFKLKYEVGASHGPFVITLVHISFIE